MAYPTTLPINLIKQIPHNTFAKLFATNFSACIYTKTNTVLERHPPIYKTTHTYQQLVLNPKYFNGLNPVLSTTYKHHQTKKDRYEINMNLTLSNKNNYHIYLEESIVYPIDKNCDLCIANKYTITLKDFIEKEDCSWNNDNEIDHNCGLILLKSQYIPTKIKDLYDELSKLYSN